MTRNQSITAAIVALMFAVSPAMAAKPDHAGNGNGKGQAKKSQVQPAQKAKPGKSSGKASADSHLYFDGGIRDIVRDYYGGEFKRGNCPPGLAKKNNGCLPPGQAKKWQVGHQLPHDVIYHDLPDDLLRRLGRTPEGYKLVRVGTDILKIGVGTGLVVEAIEDLGGLF